MKASFLSGRAAVLLSVVFWTTCRPSEDREFIVRVGSSVLTEKMIDSASGLHLRDNPALRDAYIQGWIRDEIVYQKALAEGLDKHVEFNRQMETLRRELLVQQYLNDELDRMVTVSADEIQRYYEDNKSLFLCPDDQVKTEYFLTKDRLRARRIAQQFGRMSRMVKKDFLDVVAQTASDSDLTGATEFASRDRFEPKAVRYLFARNAADEVVGPILTSDGYYALWHVVAYRLKGTPRNVDEVRHVIESRLRSMKRKHKTEEILKSLRNEALVEYGTPQE